MPPLSPSTPPPFSARTQPRADVSLMEPAVDAYLASGALPDSLTCPILHTLMLDPVCTRFAAYERAAIERHFQRQGPPTDPKTGALLNTTFLMPNQSVKTQVGEFLDLLRARDSAAARQLMSDAEASVLWARGRGVDAFVPAPRPEAPRARAVLVAPPEPSRPERFQPRSIAVARGYDQGMDSDLDFETHNEWSERAREYAEKLLTSCDDHASRGKAALRQRLHRGLVLLAARDWLDTDRRLQEFVSSYTGEPIGLSASPSELARRWADENTRGGSEATRRVEVLLQLRGICEARGKTAARRGQESLVLMAAHDWLDNDRQQRDLVSRYTGERDTHVAPAPSELVRLWGGQLAREARQELALVEVAETPAAPEPAAAPVRQPVHPGLFRAEDRRRMPSDPPRRAVPSSFFRAEDRRRMPPTPAAPARRAAVSGPFRAEDRRRIAAEEESRPRITAEEAEPQIVEVVADLS